MKRIFLVTALASGIMLTSCQNDNNSPKEECHELPDLVIKKYSKINDSTIIVNCYLDNNSIHQFIDGGTKVNIVPIFTNKNNGKTLYVDKQKLMAIDTLTLELSNKADMIYYTVKFPSPKGGDVLITKGIDLNE